MKYTWPKFKLCRREQQNLFGPKKYNIGKRTPKPGVHGAAMSRLSEYGKLLRNKQTLKRMYLLTEKQFSKIVTVTSPKYAKNNDISHDQALLQFLERRLDSVLVQAGVAETIMQARQMIVHGHRALGEVKHNVPSYFMKAWDVLQLREKYKNSPLYTEMWTSRELPSWIKFDKNKMTIELLQLPDTTSLNVPVDLLKVVEFYARA